METTQFSLETLFEEQYFVSKETNASAKILHFYFHSVIYLALAVLKIATSVSCSYVCLHIRACTVMCCALMCACVCALMGICSAVCLGPVNASNFWPIMVWHISCSTLSNYVKGWIFFSFVFYPLLSLCVIVSLSSRCLYISVWFFLTNSVYRPKFILLSSYARTIHIILYTFISTI